MLFNYKFKDIPLSYKWTLIINYLFNQSFTLLFFGLKNNFLGFISFGCNKGEIIRLCPHF